MNVAVIAMVTLLIFAEKTFPGGERIAKLSGTALLLYGAAVPVFPQLLPTFPVVHAMSIN